MCKDDMNLTMSNPVLMLDNEVLTIANIATAYESLAPNNLLTMKIGTKNIGDLEPHHLFPDNS